MLNSVSYNTFLSWPQKEEETVKFAFINPISAVKPITGNLARTAVGGAKSLLKDSWKGLSGMDKTLTVGLPLATTLPGMFNKKDQNGTGRGERLAGAGGNAIGGITGTHLGNQLAKKITTKIPGALGKGIGFAASVAGGVGGSMLGEATAKTPFNAFGKTQAPSQSYQTQASIPSPPNVYGQ